MRATWSLRRTCLAWTHGSGCTRSFRTRTPWWWYRTLRQLPAIGRRYRLLVVVVVIIVEVAPNFIEYFRWLSPHIAYYLSLSYLLELCFLKFICDAIVQRLLHEPGTHCPNCPAQRRKGGVRHAHAFHFHTRLYYRLCSGRDTKLRTLAGW